MRTLRTPWTKNPSYNELNLYKIMNTTDDTDDPLYENRQLLRQVHAGTWKANSWNGKKRERRNEQKVRTTLLRLAELEDEGTHDAAPSREGI